MEKRIKYVIITLAVLLTLALGTGGIFIFLWGKNSAENRQLKEDKKAYLALKHEQDSIIEARNNHIVILTDSIDHLVTSAIAVNDGTITTVNSIEKDKQKMHEEISNVPSLSVAEQLRLFARQSEDYRPK